MFRGPLLIYCSPQVMQWAAVNKNPGHTTASLSQSTPLKADSVPSTEHDFEHASMLPLGRQQDRYVERIALAPIPTPHSSNSLQTPPLGSSADVGNTAPTATFPGNRKHSGRHDLARSPSESTTSEKPKPRSVPRIYRKIYGASSIDQS